MDNAIDQARPAGPPTAGGFADLTIVTQAVSLLRAAVPALLFGLRLWAAVCVALYVAFYLQLDNAQWAATSAAIVCQPTLGASLRRATFRLTGTIIGAVLTVLLAAVFPQNRWGFLVGLALWGAGCGFFAAIFRDNWSYAAALAGYTAAIIASDALSSTGLAGNDVFMLAIDRASGICIGIVCAGAVLALTDLGGARLRLRCQIATVAAEIMGRFADSMALAGPEQGLTRPVRRGLIGRVVGLGPVIDEAIGETAGLRYRLPLLRNAVDGLFAALAGWRTVANSLERMSSAQGHREAGEVLDRIPPPMRTVPANIAHSSWVREPAQLAHAAREAVRRLVALPADTPTLRLMADATAEALLGLARTLDGLVLLGNLSGPVPRKHATRYVSDTLPAWITAGRVFVTIAAVELFWVVTAWPTGAFAITFAAIAVILLSPREGQAYAAAQVFMMGITLGTVLAGTIKFGLLPQVDSFAGLCLAIGLVLVPVGALSFQPWQSQVFTVTATVFFIPLLDPANVMTYDTQQFYNSTVAVFAGVGAAMLGLVLFPPLSPEARSRRLLALTCRDMHRLAAGHLLLAAPDWEARIYGRVSALAATPNPLQLAQIVAIHSIGTEIIRLRHVAPRIDLSREIEPAFAAIAGRDSTAALGLLAPIDRYLATTPSTRPADVLRARGSIRVIEHALAQHGAFMDAGG